jgi:hypothetical protein
LEVTFTATVPEPAFALGDCDPYAVVVPYCTYQLVARPPGTTDPVTVAVVAPIAVAGPVVALGAAATAALAKSASAAPTTTEAVSSVRSTVDKLLISRPRAWPPHVQFFADDA